MAGAAAIAPAIPKQVEILSRSKPLRYGWVMLSTPSGDDSALRAMFISGRSFGKTLTALDQIEKAVRGAA